MVKAPYVTRLILTFIVKGRNPSSTIPVFYIKSMEYAMQVLSFYRRSMRYTYYIGLRVKYVPAGCNNTL